MIVISDAPEKNLLAPLLTYSENIVGLGVSSPANWGDESEVADSESTTKVHFAQQSLNRLVCNFIMPHAVCILAS